jgi:ABC-type lipoprotein export system ATPase subunit
MIRVHKLTKVYSMGRVKVKALNGVTFNVANGDMLAIMGKRVNDKYGTRRL